MADSGQKALTGAAQGAAAGASFGPWGALIGGVAGGAMGLMQGDDPTAPNYVPGAPPRIPGGVSGQYGGSYYDPTTGSTQFNSWQFDPTQMGQQIDNQKLYNMLMGNGNQGLTNNLDFQAKDLLQQIQRLQGQQTGQSAIGSTKGFDQFKGSSRSWIDSEGNPVDVSDPNSLAKAKNLYDVFMHETGGTFGRKKAGGGILGGITSAINHGTLPGEKGSYVNVGDDFYRWAQSAAKVINEPALVQAWKQEQDVNKANADQRDQALKNLQNRLEYIQKAQTQVGTDTSNNPLMNFLNQRNTGQPTNYEAQLGDKYLDPLTGKWADKASSLLDQSGQPVDISKLEAIMGQAPDAKAANTKMMGDWNAKLSALGPNLGGERIADIGNYNGGRIGDFINSLVRSGDITSRNQQLEGLATNARRGFSSAGSQGDLTRLLAQQGAEDNRVKAMAQGMGLDEQAKNDWLTRQFNINQHNSDVTRLGSQAQLQAALTGTGLAQQGFNNELAAQQQAYVQRLQAMGYSSSEAQRLFQNALQATNQHTAIDQRSIENTRNDARYQDALDTQNFGNRMSLLDFLNKQNEQAFGRGVTGAQVTNQQAGIGNQVGQYNASQGTAWDQANAAGINAQNGVKFQQQVNSQAGQANAMNSALMGLGTAFSSGSWDPNKTLPYSGSTPYDSTPGLSTGTYHPITQDWTTPQQPSQMYQPTTTPQPAGNLFGPPVSAQGTTPYTSNLFNGNWGAPR